MTPTQRGAYWQLICWQMQADDGHLDADTAGLSGLADVDVSAACHAIILDAFPIQDNGKRANVRALREWTKRQVISGVRSEIGKAGIAKRWQRHSKRNSKPIAIATTSTSTSTSTSDSPQPPPEEDKATGKPSRYTWLTDFDSAWTAAMGGKMPFAKFAKSLKEAVELHGHEEALRVWKLYLATKPTEFANAADFASKFKTWERPVESRTQPKRYGGRV